MVPTEEQMVFAKQLVQAVLTQYGLDDEPPPSIKTVTIIMALIQKYETLIGSQLLTPAVLGAAIREELRLEPVMGPLVSAFHETMRNEAYAVFIWTPDEIGFADFNGFEDAVISKGNDFLEEAKP